MVLKYKNLHAIVGKYVEVKSTVFVVQSYH